MYYLNANRFTGKLYIEACHGFVDESLVLDEPEFLKACLELDNYDTVYGIVSDEVFEVLNILSHY